MAEMWKTISILSLTQKRRNFAYKKCVRYFLLHQHIQIFWYGNILKNKYRKTGAIECILLRSWLVKTCNIYVWTWISFGKLM